MLTIRNAQLHALGESRLQIFRDQLLAMLRHQIAQERSAGRAIGELPTGYVESLVDRSIAICRDEGYSQQGTIADVVRALWKNDEHPMDPPQLARKSKAVMVEQHTRVLYGRAQALNAAMQRADAAAAQE